jgi:PleD family two-component response regulator
MGISVYPKEAASDEALVKAADELLYEAKRLGKNRVCANPDESFRGLKQVK